MPEADASNNLTVSRSAVHDLSELKAMMAPRRGGARSDDAGVAVISPELAIDDTDVGFVRRVMASIHQDVPLSETDSARTAAALPVAVTTHSGPDMIVSTVQVLCTSRSGLFKLDVGTLTFLDGGALVVQNTMFTLNADRIVVNGSPPAGYAHVNIAGVPGSKGSAGVWPGMAGMGSTGKSGTCASPGIQGDSGGQGGKGARGARGQIGGTGGDGLPSLPATINVNVEIVAATTSLVISSQSGAGGPGGDGGRGGMGGIGGMGGSGATCACEGTNGGNGGDAGDGGDGGNGGGGGDGADGIGPITVNVPYADLDKVAPPLQYPAPPGPGGAGGAGGSAGVPGMGGAGGKHHGSGGSGGGGSPGNIGAIGVRGSVSGQPAQISVM